MHPKTNFTGITVRKQKTGGICHAKSKGKNHS